MMNKNKVKVKFLITENGRFLINYLFTFGYISQDLQTALRLVDSDEWDWAITNWKNPIVDEMWIDKSLLTDLLDVNYKNDDIDTDLIDDDFYDYIEEENEPFGHGFILGDVSMDDENNSETHTFRGNYYIDNGIVYCQFVGHVWHSYSGSIGYQPFDWNEIFELKFPENEIPVNVRLQKI